MSRYDEDDERHVRAEVRRFKQHLLTYATVVGALFLINVMSGGFWDGQWWFLWVALFWGIAIAFQAARLFGDEIGKDWENRTVDRIMSRRHGRRSPRPEAPAPKPARPYTPPAPPQAPDGSAPAPAAGSAPAAPSAPPPASPAAGTTPTPPEPGPGPGDGPTEPPASGSSS